MLENYKIEPIGLLIAGVEFNEQFIVGDRIYIGRNKQTVFAIVRHPVSRGVENEYFHQVGRAC